MHNTMFASFVINKPHVFKKYFWVYFLEKEYPFLRLNEFSNVSSKMAPDDTSIINAEIAAFSDDHLWKAPDKFLQDQCADILENICVIDKKDIIASTVVKASNTYPIFTVNGQAAVDDLLLKIQEY